MRRPHEWEIDLGDPQTLIEAMDTAAGKRDWSGVSAIALAGIYGELVKMNEREEKRGGPVEIDL